MTFLSNWQKWSRSVSMIVSISNTSKPDVAVGLLWLSHQPPRRLPFIWLHRGKEDQVLYKIRRKKVISTQGGGLQVFPNASQATRLKPELLTAWRGAAPLSTSDTTRGGGGGGCRAHRTDLPGGDQVVNSNVTGPYRERPGDLHRDSGQEHV